MLAKKLLVGPGSRLAVVGAPSSLDLAFVLPDGAAVADRGAAEVVLTFVQARARVRSSLAKAAPRLADGGILWLAYPKAGQLGTDLDRDILARALQAEGLEPVSQIALDDVWSALRVKRDAALSASRKVRGTFKETKAKKASAAKAKKAPTKKTTAKKAPTRKTTAKKPRR